MDKKAAELTLNVIIIAIIVLIVLAVVLFIFAGKMNMFGKGLQSCTSLQGTCVDGSVKGISEGKVTKIECPKGTAIYNTDCEPAAGCCFEVLK